MTPERVSEEDFDREFDARASLAGDGSFQLTVTLGDIGKPDPPFRFRRTILT
jgi:hypothetical protein